MQREGIRVPDEYVRPARYLDADLSARQTRELLELKDPPTCILYPDDLSAVGGFNEIRERDLKIPEDISIAGYDGNNIARIMEPKLTTLCQDTSAIGRIAAEKLVELIEQPKTALIRSYTVDGTLFQGRSVKTLPMFVQLLSSNQFRTDYGVVYVGLFVTIIPLVIIYFILSKYIVAGVALGGVKG